MVGRAEPTTLKLKLPLPKIDFQFYGLPYKAYFTEILQWSEVWSGGRDLNPRPLRPERSALAKLRYPPRSYSILSFIYSLPLPDFRNFSRFIASDLVSKFSKNIKSQGPLIQLNFLLFFPVLCCSNRLSRFLV